MWDNRCKIAVSGVGYSKVTRSAEIPLAAHALTMDGPGVGYLADVGIAIDRSRIVAIGSRADVLAEYTAERTLDGAHHVVLPGFRDDVLACIKGFDLFVLSSETEGLGTSLLDAMAAAKACIGTRAGGIPEAVAHGETGLIVPTHDPAALAQAIVQLLQDEPRRRRMGEAGRARATEKFSVERMVEATLAAYGRIPPRN